ncbi:hypothetical protein TNIN_369071 [Trichonephila inaurata madagascariensis]|uniref:Uncharacterized protein n=1 Tax=Trichonephila inaurata madagascariensis TaxID=2747483 RepID=A0A8X6XQH2_9ARAC|nr:hypothetical protein TNIN_369071 [Trichonephila inaurata madagascariensis]
MPDHHPSLPKGASGPRLCVAHMSQLQWRRPSNKSRPDKPWLPLDKPTPLAHARATSKARKCDLGLLCAVSKPGRDFEKAKDEVKEDGSGFDRFTQLDDLHGDFSRNGSAYNFCVEVSLAPRGTIFLAR